MTSEEKSRYPKFDWEWIRDGSMRVLDREMKNLLRQDIAEMDNYDERVSYLGQMKRLTVEQGVFCEEFIVFLDKLISENLLLSNASMVRDERRTAIYEGKINNRSSHIVNPRAENQGFAHGEKTTKAKMCIELWNRTDQTEVFESFVRNYWKENIEILGYEYPFQKFYDLAKKQKNPKKRE